MPFVERLCPYCGKVYSVQRANPKIFCGADCYHASQKGKDSPELREQRYRASAERMERENQPCEMCGHLLVNMPYRWQMHGVCSYRCARKRRRRDVEKYITLDKPLVEIRPEGIVCLICNKSFEQAGTHFARFHGFDFDKATSLSERLFTLHLPMGSRLASKRLRELYRTNAYATGFALGGNKFTTSMRHIQQFRLGQSEKQKLVSHLPRSAKQIAIIQNLRGTDRHGSQVRKARARCERHCQQCGNMFIARHGDALRFCSRSCSSSYSGSHRTAEARARAGRTISAVRRRLFRQDILCPQCHRSFNVQRGVARRVTPIPCCSRSCAVKYWRANRKRDKEMKRETNL